MPLRPSLATLMLIAVWHVEITNGQHHQRGRHIQPDFLSQVAGFMRETTEDLLGRENFQILAEVIKTNLHPVFRILYARTFNMNEHFSMQFSNLHY